jgi:hypothetical protein
MGGVMTGNLGESRSFEDRVFARFDAMDARFSSIDARFSSIDARFDAIDGWRDSMDVWRSATDSRFDRIEKRLGALDLANEKRALETKPIWERALAEIVELKKVVGELVRRMEVFSRDNLRIRADLVGLEERLDKVESRQS